MSRGKQITNLYALEVARLERRAITCTRSPCFKGPIPAAFIVNLSGAILLRLFRGGMYIYKKEGGGS